MENKINRCSHLSIKNELLVMISTAMIIVVFIVSYIFYSSAYKQTTHLLQKQALAIAQVAKALIDGDQFEILSHSLDIEDGYYKKILSVFTEVNEHIGEGMLYAYIDHDEDSYTYMVDGSGTVDIGFKQRKQDFSREAASALKDGNSYICEPYYIETFDKHYISAFVPILNSQKQVVGVVEYDYEESEYLQRLDGISKMVILIIILFAILLLVINYFMYAKLFKPMNQLIETMGFVADGDLTTEFNTERQDEIGDIGQAANMMIYRIHSIIRNIKQTSEKVTMASKSILVSSRDTSEVHEELAISMNEISEVIHKQTSAAKVMQSKMDDFYKGTENMKQIIDKMWEINNKTSTPIIMDHEMLGEQITDMALELSKINREIEQIDKGLKEMEQISQSVDLSTISLLAITQEQAATSEEFKEMARLLRQQAKKLDESISKFRI